MWQVQRKTKMMAPIKIFFTARMQTLWHRGPVQSETLGQSKFQVGHFDNCSKSQYLSIDWEITVHFLIKTQKYFRNVPFQLVSKSTSEIFTKWTCQGINLSTCQHVNLISQQLIVPFKPNLENQFGLIQANCCSVVSPFHWGLKLAVLLW